MIIVILTHLLVCVLTELSEVLWQMVLHLALSMKGAVGVLAAFALFAGWAGKFLEILGWLKILG